jgi:SNF2 family DNA or RNA helicase
VITPCAHVFCKVCIETVVDTVKPPSCPLCRRSPMAKSELLEAGHQENEEGEAEDSTLADMQDIVVNVSSSKINAVVKEMLRIRRDKPEDKIVVVSQFTSFLSVLQPLLQEEGFSYIRLDGTMSHQQRAEAVSMFQAKSKRSPKVNVCLVQECDVDCDNPQVLLLSLKAGGVGLNLTAANHLLLLDPAWNPASEWQCFDRIHRLGQTKNVTIYKYVTKDSVEEKMVEIQKKKKDLISGAFHMDSEERRRERITDIRNIFSI